MIPKKRLVLPLLVLFHPALFADDTALTSQDDASKIIDTKPLETPITIDKINVISHPIFDESAPDAFFIHRWANYLHINSKESTVLEQLAFAPGDKIDQKDIEEAQRLIRTVSYIRDAKISVLNDESESEDSQEVVVVETWDNWSLLPTIGLSKSGGDTKSSFGIKEDNLLGLGVTTRIKYQSTNDRTGYKFAFNSPFHLIKHANIGAEFYDNSDGQASTFLFNKPFYTLDTPNMYSVYWNDDKRVDTLKQNGDNINEFEHSIEHTTLSYGWLLSQQHDSINRLSVGLTQNKHQFQAPLRPNLVPSLYPGPLPQDRSFTYPWISYEYLQDDFSVLSNIHLINNREDFNLGWNHIVQFGIETNDIADGASVGYHVNAKSSRGWQLENHLFLASLVGEADIDTGEANFFNVGLNAEYFYQMNPKWTAYTKATIATSNNNYLDRTFALGDETGIRGYPNDYQHGDNQWVFTAELRNYPNINLYQLAELGWAFFTDVGQAFGGTDEFNETNGLIGSVGVGARIYSSKSSYGNVAHIDIAMPFSQGQHVNTWEFRFQVKDHF